MGPQARALFMDMEFTTSRAFKANDSAQELRPLGWSELCARLAAAQDLRRIGPSGQPAAEAPARWGSFHHPAALMLQEERAAPLWEDPEQTEARVNPKSSMDGNDGGGTSGIMKTISPNSSRAELIRRELP